MTKNLVDDFDRSVVGLGLVVYLDVNELYPVHDLGSIVQIFQGERVQLWEVLFGHKIFDWY